MVGSWNETDIKSAERTINITRVLDDWLPTMSQWKHKCQNILKCYIENSKSNTPKKVEKFKGIH